MKRILYLLLLFFVGLASAQEAPLAAPVAKASETKKVVGRVDLVLKYLKDNGYLDDTVPVVP